MNLGKTGVKQINDLCRAVIYFESGNVEVSGSFLKLLLDNVGSAAVFSTSARIAATIVTKQKIGILPKTGIIGGIATGLTVSYKLVSQSFPQSDNSSIIKLEGSPMKVEVMLDKDIPNNNVEFLAKFTK